VQMRHELKHIINHVDHEMLTHRLSKLFPRDEHAGAHGEYRVRSLYFDTPGDHALMDKINGVDRREKFRIRYYNDDTGFIRLEKKIKQNGLCAKKSAVLTAEQTMQIINGDILWMRESGEALLVELYSKMQGRGLRPKTIVEYIRKPFTFPAGNVRITLDREIRTGLGSVDFLSPELPLLGTFEAYGVLEVKYDRFIPDLVVQAIQVGNRRRTAFSKYAICRKYD